MTSGQGSWSYSSLLNFPRGEVLKGALLVAAGASGTAIMAALLRRRRSTKGTKTEDLVNGDEAYRSELHFGTIEEGFAARAAVDRLLCFHYGRPRDVLGSEVGRAYGGIEVAVERFRGSLNFYEELGILVERHCAVLRDFTGELEPPIALDLYCSVGRGTFELAKAFPSVWGCDPSRACINAAKTMLERGWIRYNAPEIGELVVEHTAAAPEDVDTNRIHFFEADYLDIAKKLQRPFDAVLAANCLCRMSDPRALLACLPDMVRPGGVLVIATPFDWNERHTPRSRWLGGYKNPSGSAISGENALRSELKDHFNLAEEREMTFLVRQNARKFIIGVSHVTVWTRT